MSLTSKSSAQNMRTVAIRAGVSSATVSRVLNGSPAVKKETAEHVRRIIEELKFIPNPVATALKYGRSNTYGLIIPDLTNPFYPEFLLAFENLLVENDHEVLLATTQTTQASLEHSVKRMLMRRVDGVVLMASEFDTQSIEPLLDHRIPIVTIDRSRVGKGVADVAIDFASGYQQAVRYLKELGHRRIGFLGGHAGPHTSEVRLEGFRNALEICGLRFDQRFTRAGDYRVTGGEVAMQSLLESSRRPTAILTANDLTAFGALRALHAFGVSLPSQMSVIGFDGLQLSEAVQPSLTTISVSRREMAHACIQALGKLKADVSKRGSLTSIECSLVIRESTAPPSA